VNGGPADLAQGCRRARLVGFALVASIVIDGVIVQLIRSTRAPFPGFAPAVPVDPLRMVFVVLAVADFILIRFMRSQICPRPLVARSLRPAPGNHPSPVHGQHRHAGDRPVDRDLRSRPVPDRGRPLDFYGFAVVSLLVLAVHFPRLAQWEEWAKNSAQRM
jgi:hypothetical protein